MRRGKRIGREATRKIEIRCSTRSVGGMESTCRMEKDRDCERIQSVEKEVEEKEEKEKEEEEEEEEVKVGDRG
ncbi:hypothetical protein HZH68_013276 [Vespula germanica]|uniref:Uncharacterized protein n=1 Tax=Vespula germanica TaxID=30212 RepID=A0A834JFI7_VESGE|nr:hypothetical protein HZH68_013276 [Vespula germanica]